MEGTPKPPLLPSGSEITISAHSIGMFRDKVRHPLPHNEEEVGDLLCGAVWDAVNSGSGQWFYDVGAGNAETLAVGLDEPYGDIVALLRLDEHCDPSEGYDKSFATVTVMLRARAHRAKQEGRWVDSPEPLSTSTQFMSRPLTSADHLFLTYTIAGRSGGEVVAPEDIDRRVSELIVEGADPLSFVVWERRSPIDRKVSVSVRY